MNSLSLTASALSDARAWRHDFHMYPELLYDVVRTSNRVADLLAQFGCDQVVRRVGRTGVVGLVHGRSNTSGKVIGLRADMDALPISEATNSSYSSRTAGLMHACGHDGHIAMLLAATRHLAANRQFDGTVAVVFQPAEENGGAGAKAMLDDGLVERFGIQEFYGMHNHPGLPVGQFAICPGPIMACSTRFEIAVHGRGGHAARPHLCIDPIAACNAVISALQLIPTRTAGPPVPVVLSVTQVHAGTASNVIPDEARIAGTLRTLDNRVRDLAIQRIQQAATSAAAACGATTAVQIHEGYPVTNNDARCTMMAAAAASEVVGDANVDRGIEPSMTAEDFAFMLIKRPGAMILIGNGDSSPLHSPTYDFNDAALPFGAEYWLRLCNAALRET